MRQLFVNGILVDLDENTAIGITYQTGDISEPDKKKVSTTNNFKLPLTGNNCRAFEFINSPFSASSIPYSKINVDFYEGNLKLINQGQGVISNIDKEIEFSIVSDVNIVDTLKKKLFRDLLKENFSNLGYTWGSLQLLVDDIVDSNILGLTLPMVAIQEEWFQATTDEQHINGTLMLRPSEVFNYIEALTGYTVVLSSSITSNPNYTGGNIPFYDLIPFKLNAVGLYSLYLVNDPLIIAAYTGIYPYNLDANFDYYGKKTAMDFVKMIAVMFNAIIEYNNELKQIKITAFTDIIATTSILDWSKKLISFKKGFTFGSYGIENRIKYKLDDGISEGLGIITFNSSNLNLEPIKEFTIDAIIPRSIKDGAGLFHYLLGSTNKSQSLLTAKCLPELIYLVDSDPASFQVRVWAEYQDNLGQVLNQSADKFLPTLIAYDFSGNYNSLETILTNQVKFDVVLNINLLDMYNFTSCNLVKIDQLGGVFYINKITGFNINAKIGTSVELIKIK